MTELTEKEMIEKTNESRARVESFKKLPRKERRRIVSELRKKYKQTMKENR